MTDREVMKMALEALEAHADFGMKADKAIHALRQALAQPEQEPVAWIKPDKENSGFLITLYEENGWTPLYTAPPSKPWVDLTNDEAAECWTTSAIMTWKRIQDKLREKNT